MVNYGIHVECRLSTPCMDATGDITKQNNRNYIMGEFDPSGVYIYIYITVRI